MLEDKSHYEKDDKKEGFKAWRESIRQANNSKDFDYSRGGKMPRGLKTYELWSKKTITDKLNEDMNKGEVYFEGLGITFTKVNNKDKFIQ